MAKDLKNKKARTKARLEEAEKTLLEKTSKRRGFNAKKFSGKLKGVFGNPVEYQRRIRSEW